jgi:hypothetical protein
VILRLFTIFTNQNTPHTITMKHLESKMQINCVRWFRLQYPQYAKLLFSVPNGGARKESEAKILKAEGATPGVADLVLLVGNKTHHSLCLELKTEKGKQSPSQKEWQATAEQNGNKYVIVRSIYEFISEVKKYLAS